MSAVTRALISVSDKTGIESFARALHERGIEILSTGGTAAHLREAGIPVRDVSDLTGFPEIMDGRVKTLHPRVHGGLLGRRGPDDAVMAEHGIEPIDLLVVNLYPFRASHSIENIDIGGPAMLRAAAKNHADVFVVVDPADHDAVIEAIDAGPGGPVAIALRRRLAAKAFAHTAGYDGAVSGWLGTGDDSGFPSTLTLQFDKRSDLRYGENPHQRAAFYTETPVPEPGIASARQLQGKPLSFNNIADADAALECVRALDGPACVIVKHANPCGVALADTQLEAYRRAWRTDPGAAYGGIIAFNRPLGADTAEAVIGQQFVEVIVAPDADEGAREALAGKENLRLLLCGALTAPRAAALDYRRVNGGLLVQAHDREPDDGATFRVVTKREPDAHELDDLMFAWHVARHVKSNAIVYCRERATLGIGAGQMSRVYSARLAALKAADEGLDIAGAVMASDAFFPFRDGIDAAAAAGIRAVVQPGGSKRDTETIATADEHDMAMLFTGVRHFRH